MKFKKELIALFSFPLPSFHSVLLPPLPSLSPLLFSPLLPLSFIFLLTIYIAKKIKCKIFLSYINSFGIISSLNTSAFPYLLAGLPHNVNLTVVSGGFWPRPIMYILKRMGLKLKMPDKNSELWSRFCSDVTSFSTLRQ